MLIAVSIQGESKRPCPIVQRILSKESVTVFLSVLSPAVPLGNSRPFFRHNFASSVNEGHRLSDLCGAFQSKLTPGSANFEIKIDCQHKQFVEWEQQDFSPFSLGS